MDKDLVRKLEDIIGEIKDIKVLDEQGWTSEVCRITSEKGRYVLKSSFKVKYREWLKKEAKVLKTNEFMPLPQYFGFIEQEESSHLIISFEEGITLKSALRQAESREEEFHLIESFGRFLQGLHEIEMEENPENDWLDQQLSDSQRYLEMRECDGNQKLLDHLKANKPSPVKPTFIHGDSTWDNVLVGDGEVYMFIDVAGMTVGDPRFDESLAIRKFIGDEEFLNAFYKGYTFHKVTKEEYQYFEEGLYQFF